MEDNKRFESVYSAKVRAGKRRTYFFDVRRTKSDDFYITITESTKRFQGDGYERHKIFLYKEDFNRFSNSLNEVVNHVKTELMPDFDYELYEKRQQEWEEKMAYEAAHGITHDSNSTETKAETTAPQTDSTESTTEQCTETTANDADSSSPVQSEDDMSW